MHHTLVGDINIIPQPTILSVDQCLEAVKFGKLQVSPSFNIEAKVNATIITRMFEAGSLSAEHCSGETMKIW